MKVLQFLIFTRSREVAKIFDLKVRVLGVLARDSVSFLFNDNRVEKTKATKSRFGILFKKKLYRHYFFFFHNKHFVNFYDIFIG